MWEFQMRKDMTPDQLCEKQAAYAAKREVIRDVVMAAYAKAKALDDQRDDPA
jgi:hypothetical protein